MGKPDDFMTRYAGSHAVPSEEKTLVVKPWSEKPPKETRAKPYCRTCGQPMKGQNKVLNCPRNPKIGFDNDMNLLL